jgi:chaperonin GroEL (HSP60 family)
MKYTTYSRSSVPNAASPAGCAVEEAGSAGGGVFELQAARSVRATAPEI